MNIALEMKEFIRPYFLPENIDFDILPESVKTAFITIVQPAYEELVLAAPNAIERGTGTSLVFLLTEEVLSQFEIGREMDLSQTQTIAEREQREKSFGRYLKLLGAKHAAQNALLRLRKLGPSIRLIQMGSSE